MTIAWMTVWVCAGYVAGTVATWFLSRHDRADSFAEGMQHERDSAAMFDHFEATGLAPLPDRNGFTEPEREWTPALLAALADDSGPRPGRHAAPLGPDVERLPSVEELNWHKLDPALAGALALLDAREAVELDAAARLRATLTGPMPAVTA